jgi:hypothetical protein
MSAISQVPGSSGLPVVDTASTGGLREQNTIQLPSQERKFGRYCNCSSVDVARLEEDHVLVCNLWWSSELLSPA